MSESSTISIPESEYKELLEVKTGLSSSSVASPSPRKTVAERIIEAKKKKSKEDKKENDWSHLDESETRISKEHQKALDDFRAEVTEKAENNIGIVMPAKILAMTEMIDVASEMVTEERAKVRNTKLQEYAEEHRNKVQALWEKYHPEGEKPKKKAKGKKGVIKRAEKEAKELLEAKINDDGDDDGDDDDDELDELDEEDMVCD
eukprot:TRINITY_DN1029_c1_g1_i1.p1 TRINITY_DN1029_c1_g1~~TRINITY_DN1029_c1_g1_i1.p1  ORF type:complete len:204 (+),score=97.66 TRINITY_DN1029_c1_g1_i1:30-641(+)